jgi:membrane protein DedA with SNARE-associated domain
MHLESLISAIGYPAVFFLVMGECMGIPLPGETGLLIAAAASGTGKMFVIWWVIVAAASGAIVGDTLGYWIGRRGGRSLVLRLTGKFFIKREHLEKAEVFFLHHGGKAVFFGRSVSYLRVLTALLAGVSRMYYPKFLLFNALGGIAWAVVFGLAGYAFGKNLGFLEERIREIGWGGLAVFIMAVIVYFLWKKAGWFKKKNNKVNM